MIYWQLRIDTASGWFLGNILRFQLSKSLHEGCRSRHVDIAKSVSGALESDITNGNSRVTDPRS
jgi:hypothetical protein